MRQNLRIVLATPDLRPQGDTPLDVHWMEFLSRVNIHYHQPWTQRDLVDVALHHLNGQVGGGRWGNCCLFGMVLLPEANSPLVLLAGGSRAIRFLLEMVLPHELLKQHYGSEQSFTTVELCRKCQQRVRKKY